MPHTTPNALCLLLLPVLLSGCTDPTAIDSEPDDDCTVYTDWERVTVTWSRNLSWERLRGLAPDVAEGYEAASPTPSGMRQYGGDCGRYGDDIERLDEEFWGEPDARTSHLTSTPSVRFLVFRVDFPDGEGLLMYQQER